MMLGEGGKVVKQEKFMWGLWRFCNLLLLLLLFFFVLLIVIITTVVVIVIWNHF